MARRWIAAALVLAGAGAWAVLAAAPPPVPRAEVGVPVGAVGPVGTGRHAVGEQAGWRDGVTAVVREVRRTTFGPLATTPGPGLRITVSVSNGSRTALVLEPVAEVRLAGRRAEPVFATGCDGPAVLVPLAPGRTTSGVLCFAGTARTADIALTPAYAYRPAVWRVHP